VWRDSPHPSAGDTKKWVLVGGIAGVTVNPGVAAGARAAFDAVNATGGAYGRKCDICSGLLDGAESQTQSATDAEQDSWSYPVTGAAPTTYRPVEPNRGNPCQTFGEIRTTSLSSWRISPAKRSLQKLLISTATSAAP
jgi:hypothetical protein